MQANMETIDEEFEKGRGPDKVKRKSRATSGEMTQRDLESPNWHTRTMAKMKTLPEESLRFIIKDATEAAENAEGMNDSIKAGQYRDEVHYANMELRQRQMKKARILGVLTIDEEYELQKGILGKLKRVGRKALSILKEGTSEEDRKKWVSKFQWEQRTPTGKTSIHKRKK